MLKNNQNKILLTLQGGLGNQLLQYLAAKYLQKKFKIRKLDFYHLYDKDPMLNYLIKDEDLNFLKNIKNNKNNIFFTQYFSKKLINVHDKLSIFLQSYDLNYHNNRIFFREKESLFNRMISLKSRISFCEKILKHNTRKKCTIDILGFWQNPKFYLNNLQNIVDDFNKKLILRNDFNVKPGSYITFHARRGDYINKLNNAIEYYSNYQLLTYLKTSIDILPSDLRDFPLYILSDDIEWFKSINIKGLLGSERKILFGSNNPLYDWTLINNAALNIISNSTFSFSASLLNKENQNLKIRTIMPFWYSQNMTTYQKGWSSIPGFISI